MQLCHLWNSVLASIDGLLEVESSFQLTASLDAERSAARRQQWRQVGGVNKSGSV